MKLRFYMRGLGIGIIITALILGIHFRGQSNGMTDEQVIERAKSAGIKLFYTIGGSGRSQNMGTVFADASLRATFVASATSRS